MGKTIKVIPEELAKASQKLQDLSTNYTDIYTQLMEEATTIRSWSGEDSAAFVEQISGFCDNLKSMADKLSSASSTLEKQRANYVDRQQNIITEVKKLPN